MAAPPVTPQEIKDLIPAANSNLCKKMLSALVKIPTVFYKLIAWALNEDGTPTTEFKEWIGVTVGQLAAPLNVQASDGTYTDHVSLTWDPSSGATFYSIWRALSNDNTTAVQIATSTTPSYTDSAAPADEVQWYFVKSHNATDQSGFSLGSSGFTDTSGGGGTGSSGVVTLYTNDIWVVPTGVATIQVEVWGGAGGGGGSSCPFCTATSAYYSGGGGGSGEYLKVKTIPVTTGQTLQAIGGGPGSAGSSSSGGNAGDDMILRRSGVDLVLSNGGSGGNKGNFSQTGAGGVGGSGGTASVGAIDVQTAGNAGTSGSSGFPVPSGGVGGAAVAGAPGPGGNGGSNSGGTAGARGAIKITWPSP